MFKIDNQNLPLLIFRTICAFWVFLKLLCYTLWHTDRLFPVSPPFSFLDHIPNGVHVAFFLIAICGMVLLLIVPRNKWLLSFVILAELFSCLLDQNRWQPWEYQFLLVFCFALFFRNNPRQFLNYLIFLLAAIYINSGLHKLSGGFLHNGWDRMILGNLLELPGQLVKNKGIHYSGLLLGIVEALAGVGLLLSKNKRIPAILLIIMHLIVLGMLSPAGINHNFIIWPWNLAMIILIAQLFLTSTTHFIELKSLVANWNILPFILIGILPLLSFAGRFDNYLSFNLYSGTPADMEICINDRQTWERYKRFGTNHPRFCKSLGAINITGWALKELSVPVYPEERVYKDIILKFKEANPYSGSGFYIFRYPYKAEDICEYH